MAKQYRMTPMKRLVSAITALMARRGAGNFVVVTTRGRKSGEPRQVTVSPLSRHDVDYVVSPYGDVSWVRNVRAQPEVLLRRGETERRVRLVEETGDHPDLVSEYYHREGFARRYMQLPDDPTEDDFSRLADHFPVFRIEPIG